MCSALQETQILYSWSRVSLPTTQILLYNYSFALHTMQNRMDAKPVNICWVCRTHDVVVRLPVAPWLSYYLYHCQEKTIVMKICFTSQHTGTITTAADCTPASFYPTVLTILSAPHLKSLLFVSRATRLWVLRHTYYDLHSEAVLSGLSDRDISELFYKVKVRKLNQVSRRLVW